MSFRKSPRLPSSSRSTRLLSALLVAAGLTLLAAPFAARAAEQVAWRMVTEYPESNISGIGITTFARLVSERTGGLVTVAPAFDNSLKITSADMPRAAREGRIEAGDAFSGALSGFD